MPPSKCATSPDAPASLDSAARDAEVLGNQIQAKIDMARTDRASDPTEASVDNEYVVPACTLPKCLMVLAMGNLLTPLDTQAPTPLLPLLITVDLNDSITAVGRVFAALTMAALISFGLLLPLSKAMSPKSILLLDYSVRLVSGLVYSAALITPGGHSYSLTLLYASRFLYGLTLNTFAMPSAWIGVRMPVDKRAAMIANMAGVLGLGIVFGPVWGSVLASMMPTKWLGYQSTGIFTLVECCIMLVMVQLVFDDTEKLPTPKKIDESSMSRADRDEASKVKFITHAAAFSSLLLTMGLMAGFETLMSLAVYHSYGWDSKQALRAWLPFGACVLVAFGVMKQLFHFVSR